MKKIAIAFILLLLLANPVWAATVNTDSINLIATPPGNDVSGALVESISISMSRILVYATSDTELTIETELDITPCQCLVYAPGDIALSVVPTITDSVEAIVTPTGDEVNGGFIERIFIAPCQVLVYATDDMVLESFLIDIIPGQSIVISPMMGNQRKWRQFRTWAGGREWGETAGIEWKCNKQALMDSN